MNTENNSSSDRPRLLSEFPPVSIEQWQQEVERLLKGADFRKKMFTRTGEGITVKPLYTADDAAGSAWVGELPGCRPFVRGNEPLGQCQRPWLIAQQLSCPTALEFNTALRNDLERGQTAVNLVLDEATQAGLDPGQASPGQVGKDGVSIASLADLSAALDGVDLEAMPVIVQTGDAVFSQAAMLIALMRRLGKDPSQLRGSIGNDPICGLAELGTVPMTHACLYDQMAWLTLWAEDNAPNLKTIAAYGFPYSDGGGNAVQELAFTLAAAVQHLRELETRGVEPGVAAARIQFGLPIGSNFFMEIAKLRAARRLWSEIVAACGGNEQAQTMSVHARTTRNNLTLFDPHVNILRTTTEAMSAVLGGCDSLHVTPFDQMYGLPNELSRRLARNTQLILQQESHLDAVADPAGGSWYIESLTDDLADKAWELFQQIEQAGGMLTALEAGLPQRLIAEHADQVALELNTGRSSLIGTTRYPNPTEKMLEWHVPDYEAIHDQRVAQLQQQRSDRETAGHQRVVSSLAATLEARSGNMFEAVVDSVAQGVTVGELAGILRSEPGTPIRIEAIPRRRLAEDFENLRSAVDRRAADDSAACRVFCANLGNPAGYMPRLDFARGFFQVAGFEVEADQYFDSVRDAIGAVQFDGAGTVCIIGLDETYRDSALELVKALQALEKVPEILIAGYPKPLIDDLKDAGVDAFIHLRSDVFSVLSDLARSKGVAI